MGTVINYLKLLPIPLLFSIILWACSTSSEEPELEQKSEIKIDSNILAPPFLFCNLILPYKDKIVNKM